LSSNDYIYDFNGNMIFDRSKQMSVQYDWRNMPVKFSFYDLSAYSGTVGCPADVRTLENTSGASLTDINMTYDASGNRVKKETVDFSALSTGQTGGTGSLSAPGLTFVATGSSTPISFAVNGSLRSSGGSSGSPITSIPGGSLVVEYTDDNGTTSTDAVFTAAGAADFSGTVTQQSGLTSETPNAFELFNSYSNPDGASAALPIMSMDPEGDANFIGITIQDLFTSGVAYVDNNYIFTTGSGLSPYTLDYSLFGGEGREEFGSSPALFRYYLKDHLGSTRAVWAPDVGSGQLTEATGYLPYGTQVPIITPTGDEATREKFTGKELDKDGVDAGNTITGVRLDYFGARYYDAMVGVWVACDPKKQYYSPYSFVGNNPISCFDPNGKDGLTVAVAGQSSNAYASQTQSFAVVLNINAFFAGNFSNALFFQLSSGVGGPGEAGAANTFTSSYSTSSPKEGTVYENYVELSTPLEGVTVTTTTSRDMKTGEKNIDISTGPGEEGGASGGVRVVKTVNAVSFIATQISNSICNFFNTMMGQ